MSIADFIAISIAIIMSILFIKLALDTKKSLNPK